MRPRYRLALSPVILLFLAASPSLADEPAGAVPAPFGIHIVDSQSGRGVPCVRLQTVDQQVFVTDSGGWVAIVDPALMGQKVFFTITSFGYEYPADGFGMHGSAVQVTPGGRVTLKIMRLNIAQRLYRTTGVGIYRDTIMLGMKAPIKQPLLNGKVAGQDSVQSAVYLGRIFFFWGDTSWLTYPLGLFRTAGATAELPGKGGLDPSVGINYRYFVGSNGFVRAMVPGKEPGPVWIDGVTVAKDRAGREHMLAHAARVQSLDKIYERSLIIWDDKSESFQKLRTIPLDAPVAPRGHPFRASEGGVDYFYYPVPYPAIRVPAKWEDVQDLSKYQAYTCLKPGTKFNAAGSTLDIDSHGNVVWGWKSNTPPLDPKEIDEWVKAKLLHREDLPFRLQDAASGKPILLAESSVYWNEYRRKFILIGEQSFGASMVGEIWYAEADKPEGPWTNAVKIVTHDMEIAGGLGGKHHVGMDFYNPMQQPFFDQDHGRLIYFEGTYVTTFSGNPNPTPRYDYNNQMYQLDLSDPRLQGAELPR